MSLTIEYIDTAIYLARWQGQITQEDVHITTLKLRALSNDYGDQKYCLIIDLTAVDAITADIGCMADIAQATANVTCIAVRTAAMDSMCEQALNTMTGQDYVPVDTVEAGEETARQLLAREPEAF